MSDYFIRYIHNSILTQWEQKYPKSTFLPLKPQPNYPWNYFPTLIEITSKPNSPLFNTFNPPVWRRQWTAKKHLGRLPAKTTNERRHGDPLFCNSLNAICKLRGNEAGWGMATRSLDIVRNEAKRSAATGAGKGGRFLWRAKNNDCTRINPVRIDTRPGTGIAICMRSQQWNTTALAAGRAEGCSSSIEGVEVGRRKARANDHYVQRLSNV